VVNSSTKYGIKIIENNTECSDSVLVKISPKIKTSPITGPSQLKPIEKGLYSVTNSTNIFFWTVQNANINSVQGLSQMEILAGSSGEITLQVKESNKYCVDSALTKINIVKPPPTSVGSGLNSETVKIYPNPATDELFVEFGNEIYNHILITDIRGKVVISINDNHQESLKIDVSQLSKGVYAISLKNEERVKVVKLVVGF
jgi:hypothetical protein